MTLLERRDIYWQMYFCAEGLKRLAPELINQYNDASLNNACLPGGMCYLLARLMGIYYDGIECFTELIQQRPENWKCFWFKKSDWKIRQVTILEAIKLTYETEAQLKRDIINQKRRK